MRGATIFPHQINVAASFDTAHASVCGKVTAKDTRAAALPWVFAPILGPVRNPLWART